MALLHELHKQLESLLHAARDMIDALEPINTLPIVESATLSLLTECRTIEIRTGRSGGMTPYWQERNRRRYGKPVMRTVQVTSPVFTPPAEFKEVSITVIGDGNGLEDVVEAESILKRCGFAGDCPSGMLSGGPGLKKLRDEIANALKKARETNPPGQKPYSGVA